MNGIELVREWFKFAENDLLTARHIFENMYPKQTYIACYHSHQCAEKALKGYLLYKIGIEIELPRIHDLKVLCDMCIQKDRNFDSILTYCQDLNPLGVNTRYPSELSIGDAITQLAIYKSEKVYNFCYGKILELKENE